MFVDYRGTIRGLLGWQWRAVVVFTVLASAVVALDRVLGLEVLELHALPLGVLGGAIGIFVSFRTNSAYDRWWEGRRLWGQLVNTSRHFTTQVLTYAGREHEAQRSLVRRHIAYVHTLRCLLRNQDAFEDADVRRFLDETEREELQRESNPTHALLHRQTEELVRLADRGAIDTFRLQSLDRTIATLLDVQGGCERIKRTPFPPGYGFLATRLVQLYAILLPMALVHQLGWIAVPITALVCLGFTLIGEVGRVLEDPFTMFWPALPLAALATTIEINLRQRLGETDVPPLPKPNAQGILM
ncbi:MAG TPA: bestrophin family protein [Nannocystaceae bacterium]|nr:bestrophin family protein [Nannocystaceae bacterium]